MLGDLSAHYESNGYAGAISDCPQDPGGKSYGTYQFSSNAGSLRAFVDWLKSSDYSYMGETLDQYELCSADFDAAWVQLANTDGDDFRIAQHDYIKYAYYDPAISYLANAGWNIDNHNQVMQDVVWSRSVQYGPGNIVEMWEDAVHQMWNEADGENTGYPNLSYIDSSRFDYDMITAIYLIVCSSVEWNNSALRDNLNDRFDSECHDALGQL
jgi:hypothetical protein